MTKLGMPVPMAIRQRVRETPDDIAVISASGALTYAELDQQAGRVAAELIRGGVRRGDIVGVSLGRTLDVVVALLAVWRAGATYLPLDPAYPQQRLKMMTQDAGVRTTITTVTIAAAKEEPVSVDLMRQIDELTCELTDIAYVIYTSGSTGVPKGVKITHGNLLGTLTGTQQALSIPDRAVWSSAHSVSFDFSVWELWGALWTGGSVLLLDDIQVRSPQEMASLLGEHRVNVLSQTPSAFRHLMPALLDTGVPESLNHIILGGEAIAIGEFTTWLNRYPRARVHNLYGITEGTVHVTAKSLERSDLTAGVSSPIGAALPGACLAVVRDDGRLAERGEGGELLIGGVGVAAGYLNRPDLTAERFITRNLPGLPATRWYKTGDRVRELDGGVYEYLGRMDRQVKVRGYRIELGEIEAALLRRPQIAAAVVEPHGTSTDRWLVAYVALAPDVESVSEDELRTHLRAILPGYMIPRAFISVPAMPLTLNGKVDRSRLPVPETLGTRSGEPSGRLDRAIPQVAEMPDERVEAVLAGIWQEILGTTQIRRSDSFFARGGDSMSALEVVAAAADAGIVVSVQALYRAPILRDFAALVRSQQPEPDANDDWHAFQLNGERPVPNDIEDAYPLTRAQLGMLYEYGRHSQTPLYHVTAAMHLTGLKFAAVDDFVGALRVVAESHPLLRVGIRLEATGGRHMVHRSIRVPCAVVDMRGDPPDRSRAAFDQWIAKEAATPFDPESVPLWRVGFFRTGDTSGYLGITHHHVILDGWSVALLFKEFERVLSGQPCQGEPAFIFPRFVALEAGSKSAGSELFWRDLLDRCASSGAAPQSPADGTTVHQMSVPLRGPLRKRLAEVASKARYSIKSVFLGAHLEALRAIDPQTNATLLVSHGRPEVPGAERALGMFLNNLPFPLPTTPPRTYMELIAHCARQEAESFPHRRFPYADMAGPGRASMWSLFNFVDFSTVGPSGYYDRLPDNNLTEIPLTVSVTEKALIVELRCAQRAKELGDDFTDAFLKALGQIAQDPFACLPVDNRRPPASLPSAPTNTEKPFRLPRADVAPPTTRAEKALVDIWRRVLATDVGPDDNFFAVGGDSLKALQAIALIREDTGIRLPVSVFVGEPDLASLARFLERRMSNGDT